MLPVGLADFIEADASACQATGQHNFVHDPCEVAKWRGRKKAAIRNGIAARSEGGSHTGIRPERMRQDEGGTKRLTLYFRGEPASGRRLDVSGEAGTIFVGGGGEGYGNNIPIQPGEMTLQVTVSVTYSVK